MSNKLFSIITFIFIVFSIYIFFYIIGTADDSLDIKNLDEMVEKEIQEFKHLKRKHIDTH
jgi:HJR/Mrr/RecB family endonuclease